MLASEPDSENIVCDNCDSEEHPETRCQQCTRFLCQFCTESHKRSRDTKTHTLSTLDELRESDLPVIAETVRCQKHEDEVIKLYCKTCQETICRDCTIVDHRQHDYVFARDVSQEKKDELLRLVGEVKQKRSKMAESLEYLKKLEEIVNESNESTVPKINQYFNDLVSVAKSKQNEFLEEATAVKNAKLKQLHIQREELELNVGSCDSSIEFTEQAFKNGNDVQILKLTKYMAQCLESLKNKKSEVHPPHVDDDQPLSVTELPDHVNICDRMAQFHFVGDGSETSDMYTAAFTSPREYLEVGVQSEVIIQPKDSSMSTQDKNRGKIAISPSFEGVAVEDVVIEDNDDGSRTVRFRPIHVGELTFVAYVNFSRVSECVLTKTVKTTNALTDGCRIGDHIFESGIHTWKIVIDHSDCSMALRVDFTVGVINSTNSSTAIFKGYVRPNSCNTVSFTLDMEGKKLQMKFSWNYFEVKKFDLKSYRRVFPYFWSNCNECKLTVTALADDWCFIRYKKIHIKEDAKLENTSMTT